MTVLIEEEYYRTEDEAERIVLLEAMTNPKHNPELASPWAIDIALHSDSSEHRQRAMLYIKNLYGYNNVFLDVVRQVYDSSTRPEQRIDALTMVGTRAPGSRKMRDYVRERLRDPKPEEIMALLSTIQGWGTEKDAAYIESIASEFPSMSDALKDKAEQIRMFRRMHSAEELKKLDEAQD